jgi:type VI secretion system protein ImpA
MAASGSINSREDVVRLLDRVCDYYARVEPSSPVPLLLVRAKRLVNKDFLEAIRDIAPGGLAEVKVIGGIDSDE